MGLLKKNHSFIKWAILGILCLTLSPTFATEKAKGAPQTWTSFWAYYYLSDSSHVYGNFDNRFSSGQTPGDQFFDSHYRSHIELGYNHYVSKQWNLGASGKWVNQQSDGSQGFFKGYFEHLGQIGGLEFRKGLRAEYLYRPTEIANRVINDQARFGATILIRKIHRLNESWRIMAEAGLLIFVKKDLEAETFIPFEDRFVDQSRWWVLAQAEWKKTLMLEMYFMRSTEFAFNSLKDENFNLFSHNLGITAKWCINQKGMEIRWK